MITGELKNKVDKLFDLQPGNLICDPVGGLGESEEVSMLAGYCGLPPVADATSPLAGRGGQGLEELRSMVFPLI